MFKKLMLLALSTSLLVADTPETPGANEPVLVQTISEEKIRNFELSLQSSERKRTAVRIITAGAVAAGAGYVIYRTFFKKDEKPALDARVSALEGVVRANAAAAAAALPPVEQPGFFSRALDAVRPANIGGTIVGGVKGFGGWVADKAPGVVGFLVMSRLYSEANHLLFGWMPSFAKPVVDYLANSWTMHWALTKGTQFHTVVRMNMGLIARETSAEPTLTANGLKELSALSYMLINEAEKALGYMRFVRAQLTAEQSSEKMIARTCMTVVRDESNLLIEKINAYLINTKSELKDKYELFMSIKNCLYAILSQMENFEVVSMAAGYYELDEADRYSPWKNLVMPELAPQVPQLGQMGDPELQKLIANLNALPFMK